MRVLGWQFDDRVDWNFSYHALVKNRGISTFLTVWMRFQAHHVCHRWRLYHVITRRPISAFTSSARRDSLEMSTRRSEIVEIAPHWPRNCPQECRKSRRNRRNRRRRRRRRKRRRKKKKESQKNPSNPQVEAMLFCLPPWRAGGAAGGPMGGWVTRWHMVLVEATSGRGRLRPVSSYFIPPSFSRPSSSFSFLSSFSLFRPPDVVDHFDPRVDGCMEGGGRRRQGEAGGGRRRQAEAGGGKEGGSQILLDFLSLFRPLFSLSLPPPSSPSQETWFNIQIFKLAATGTGTTMRPHSRIHWDVRHIIRKNLESISEHLWASPHFVILSGLDGLTENVPVMSRISMQWMNGNIQMRRRDGTWRRPITTTAKIPQNAIVDSQIIIWA